MSIARLCEEHHERVIRVLAEHDPESYGIIVILERYGAHNDLLKILMSNLGCNRQAADHIIKQAVNAYWTVYRTLVG